MTKAALATNPQPPASDVGSSAEVEPIQVDLTLHTQDTQPSLKRWLVRQLKLVAALAAPRGGRLSVAVVGDDEMVRLHQQFKDTAGTTDVLTFDLRTADDEKLDAELILCRDEAARQAAARGHDVRLELLLYAVHGLLHLLGYDDHLPREARLMHQREDQLLTAVGLPPVYVRAGGAARA